MNNQPSNFNQQKPLVSVPQEPREKEMPRKCKRRTLEKNKATPIRGCSLTFNLVKAIEDQVTYILKVDKVNDVPLIEKTEESNTEQLPVTSLLEQWGLEVRKRVSGRIDRVFSHPRSTTRFRSLIQVSRFIEDHYYPNSSEKLQIRLAESKIPLDKMSILSANNSVEEGTPVTTLNEEVQPNVKQEALTTADEILVAKTLGNGLPEDIDLNVKLEPVED